MANYTNKSLQGHEGKALTLLPADIISFTVSEFGLNNSSGDPQFSWDGSGTVGVLQLGATGGNEPKLQFGGTGGSQDGPWSLYDNAGSLRLTNTGLSGTDALNFDTSSFVIGNSTDETPVDIYGMRTLVADPVSSDTINLTGSLIISQDLTVNGTTVTVNVETLTVEDNIIELASNNIGNLLDIGWIGYRGSDSIGGGGVSNVAVYWDYDANTFAMATTDDDASTPGLDITPIDYMPLRVGSVYASDAALTSNFSGNVNADLGLDVTGGQLTANAGGTFSGSTDWLFSGGDVHLNDGINLELGTSKELTLVHSVGGASFITNTTGDLTIENSAAAGILVVLGSTTDSTYFQVQDSNNASLVTVFGNGQVDIVTALNLPFQDSLGAEGNIRYNSGTQKLEYHTASGWVELGTTTGSTLQAAYVAGNTIDLAQAEGDLAITLDDGPSAGAGIADFTVLGTGAENYIATDALNTRVLIGDGANSITTAIGGHMVFPTDNTYDIGASGATRPRRVYAGTEVVVGDTTLLTLGSAAIAADIAADTGLTVSTGALATDDMIFSASLLSDNAFRVQDSTNSRAWLQVDMANADIYFGNITDNPDFTFTGTGRLNLETATAAFNLPTGNPAGGALEGDLRYNAGVVQFYTTEWVTLAASTGSVSLQAAYDTGQTIQLATGEGDMVITTSADSIGGDFADFMLEGSAGGFLATDEGNDRLLIGDTSVDAYMQASDLLWTADGNGNIGANGANRPDHIYAKTDVKIGDSITIATASITGTAGVTVTSGNGTDIALTPGTGGRVDVAVGLNLPGTGGTDSRGNIRYDSTGAGSVEYYDETDNWIKLANATSDITLQEAYDAGPTITLAAAKGDLEFIIDEVGTEFIVRGVGASIGDANDYIKTDGANALLKLGEASATATLVQTDVLGGLTVTDELDGDLDAALSVAATLGRNLAEDEQQAAILVGATSGGLGAGELGYGVASYFTGHSGDDSEATLAGLTSVYLGNGGGSANAVGLTVTNTTSDAEFIGHIFLQGGAQGDDLNQIIAADQNLVLTAFGGSIGGGTGNVILSPTAETITTATFIFDTDNVNDIGHVAANRPASVYVGTEVEIGGASGLSLLSAAVNAGGALSVTSGSSQDINITSDANLKLTAGTSSDIWNEVQGGQGTAWKIVEGATNILWVNTGTEDIRGVYPLTLTYGEVQSGESVIQGTGTSVVDANGAAAINGTMVSGGLTGAQSFYGVVGSVSGMVDDSGNATLTALLASNGGKGTGSANLMGLQVAQGFDYDIFLNDSTANITAVGALDINATETFDITLANVTSDPEILTITAINSGGGDGDTSIVIQTKTEMSLTCSDGDIVLSPGPTAGVVDVNTAFNLPFGQANERKGNLAYNDGDNTIQYFNGTIWISLQQGSGPNILTLQGAYDNGTNIALTQAKGDLVITLDDGPSAGAGIADFTLAGTGAENYLTTDALNTRIVLGDGANAITVDLLDDTLLRFGTTADASINFDADGNERLQFAGADVELGSNLVFGAQNTYDIGSLADDAANGYRPRDIYSNNSVIVGSTVTIDTNGIDASAGLAITSTDTTSFVMSASDASAKALTITATNDSGSAAMLLTADDAATLYGKTEAGLLSGTPSTVSVVLKASGQLEFSAAAYLKLPVADASGVEGNLRYDTTGRSGDGTIEFYDGTGNWIEVAAATGDVSLQDAYNAGQTIDLDKTLGNMAITLDPGLSVGDTQADFTVMSTGGEHYLSTDVDNGMIVLGDGGNNVIVAIYDALLGWATDGGGDIGAVDGNRPDQVYVKTAVVVEDLVGGDEEKIVLTEQDLTFTANSALAKTFTISGANSGASVCNYALTTDGRITLTPTTALVMTVGASSLWTFNSNDDDALILTDGVVEYLTLNTTTDAQQIEFGTFVQAPRGADVNDNTGPCGGGVVMADGDSGLLATGYVVYADYLGGETKARRADANAAGGSIGEPDPANVFGVVVAKNALECQINTIHGMPVPVYFQAAPTTNQNGKIVYLSNTPGYGQLTAPTEQGTDVWQLGILIGADGASNTPNVIWMPQFRYSNA